MTSSIYLIDDDDGMRHAITLLLTFCGYDVHGFEGAASFLDHLSLDATGCVIVDLRMPEIDSLAFQRRQNDAGAGLPLIFVSGYADVALTVRAMQQGCSLFPGQAVPRAGPARRGGGRGGTRTRDPRRSAGSPASPCKAPRRRCE